MKHLLFLSVLGITTFSFIPGERSSKSNFKSSIDSGTINHELDGLTTEWPANKFEQDKTTNIKYAVDNDAKNLFIAMVIPDRQTEMKIMSQGMLLYIDTKGKKKEGKGIKFPVTVVSTGGAQMTDIKQVRSMMAPNLLSLQQFGFTEEESKNQEIMKPGSVNIQFNWDDKDIMHIEYSIPLTLIEDNTSLSGKTISLGWKIKEAEVQAGRKEYTTSTTKIVSVPSGSGPIRSPGNPGGNPSGADNKIREHSFWTKYTVSPVK